MKYILITIYCITLVLSGTASPAMGESLNIAYTSFYPFFSRDTNNRMTGIFYEIINEAIVNRMKIKVSWKEFPWKRCQQNVRENYADGMITTINPQRMEYTSTHRDPFFVQSVNIFTYKGHARMSEIKRLKSFADIKEKGFSIITYLGNGWIEEHAESIGIKTNKVTLRDRVWQMLAHKRGDMVIEWPGGAWFEIRKFKLTDEIVETGAVINTVRIHLLIGKKSPYIHILPGFNTEIKKMTEDGTIKKITDKYCPMPSN
ncbi:transporter substrate-binding domain-containing protein [Maridesulfovibrio sp.]|uniref:substrate-binding periplasmic protein n=1 Tax=Maridesulfovibrio sp. TaxID=2795000 RepID=UPI0029F5C359|nr:transporter substrate-binding domain-containing protein [Maridesulfovibrio sp.]